MVIDGQSQSRNFSVTSRPPFSRKLCRENPLAKIIALVEPNINFQNTSQSEVLIPVTTSRSPVKKGIHLGIIVEDGSAM